MAKYSFVDNEGSQVLTVFHNGELVSVTSENPRFDQIFELVRNGDVDYAVSIISPEAGIREYFEKVSEQVSVKNGEVLYEGLPVHGVLVDKIIDFYESGTEDFKPLVLFLEKLEQNPNLHSVEHLYRWLEEQNLTISDSGDIVAYKGVSNDFRSIHAGDGIVDGVQFFKTQLPNNPGSVVEMPRHTVTFDPANGCSFGLHAGTWDYANSFGARTLEVHINPRDVVSVPSDCADQKMRVCRYTVVQELEKPYDSEVVRSWDYDHEDDLGDEDDLDDGDFDDYHSEDYIQISFRNWQS